MDSESSSNVSEPSLVWEVKRTKQIVPISPGGGEGLGGGGWDSSFQERHPTGFWILSVTACLSVLACQLLAPATDCSLASHVISVLRFSHFGV